MASAEKKCDITEKEAKVLALAWMCFKTQPEINIEKLAKLAGYSSPKSISNMICGVKKKAAAFAINEGNGGEGPSTPANRASKAPKAKATRTPVSRKRKAAGDNEGDSSDPTTPTRSKRARGKKAALSKVVVEYDDSEDGKNGMKKESDDEHELPEDVVD
ncbi:hypothetical protein F4781DRAFT_97114 [Annulohypoxylon bovei var. microspora]|nr:hypothetical protein F4781DRAFT_97114 [Annulohypoxylon bovei var. microspora]